MTSIRARVFAWGVAMVGIFIASLGILGLSSVPGALQEDRERGAWLRARGTLNEVGIRYERPFRSSSFYEMTARYTYHVDGRPFEDTSLWGDHRRGNLKDVLVLVVPYAPAAANLSEDDFGFMHAQEKWPGAGQTIPVRYDPREPSHAVMELPGAAPMYPPAHSLVAQGLALLLVVVGTGIVAAAWPRLRRASAAGDGAKA